MASSLLIGFGTETGNSELLAMDMLGKAKDLDFEAKCACLDEVGVDDFKAADYLIIICSTWGDGEQPDNAQDLYDAVEEIGDDELDVFNLQSSPLATLRSISSVRLVFSGTYPRGQRRTTIL